MWQSALIFLLVFIFILMIGGLIGFLTLFVVAKLDVLFNDYNSENDEV